MWVSPVINGNSDYLLHMAAIVSLLERWHTIGIRSLTKRDSVATTKKLRSLKALQLFYEVQITFQCMYVWGVCLI